MTMNFMVQSPALSADHVEMLAALAQAQGVHRMLVCAARLMEVATQVDVRAEVMAYAQANLIDAALVPAGHTLSSCKLLAMDMDSTLINIECIDELADLAKKRTCRPLQKPPYEVRSPIFPTASVAGSNCSRGCPCMPWRRYMPSACS